MSIRNRIPIYQLLLQNSSMNVKSSIKAGSKKTVRKHKKRTILKEASK
jgi:hypothetical protein